MLAVTAEDNGRTSDRGERGFGREDARCHEGSAKTAFWSPKVTQGAASQKCPLRAHASLLEDSALGHQDEEVREQARGGGEPNLLPLAQLGRLRRTLSGAPLVGRRPGLS